MHTYDLLTFPIKSCLEGFSPQARLFRCPKNLYLRLFLCGCLPTLVAGPLLPLGTLHSLCYFPTVRRLQMIEMMKEDSSTSVITGILRPLVSVFRSSSCPSAALSVHTLWRVQISPLRQSSPSGSVDELYPIPLSSLQQLAPPLLQHSREALNSN